MVPLPWADRLSKSTRRATIFVALHLLRLTWKSKGAPVALSNLGLAEWGVSRREKWRALAELEALELIVVERLKIAPRDAAQNLRPVSLRLESL
jgi:hypothetical protein